MNDNQKSNTGAVPAHLVLPGVVACFVLSGFAALLYQTAWMRQFSLVFGTSELAVAAVLAAYMGGLALGAAIAARYVHRISRPVLFYGLLEGGIALAALAVPLLLRMASYAYAGILGDQPEPVDASGLGQSFFYLAVAFVVLALPTCFMGATLPVLTRYVVHSRDQIGTRVGLLYATNTAGAIAGTVVAGFVLLPALGLNGTVYVGVAVNGLVFVLAAIIAKSTGVHELEAPKPVSVSDDAVATIAFRRWWILPVIMLSGAASFVYEVLWTRLLGHVLGGSITAFATMLASFLGGIAIGSAIASRYSRTEQQAARWFIVVQCGIALTSMLVYWALPLAAARNAGLAGNVLFAIGLLVPATICIGATFPLAVRILAVDSHDAGPSSARIYAWNTTGAIVGATIAAFYLIPAFKYEGAVKIVVLGNLLLAIGAAIANGPRFKVATAGVVVGTIAVAAFYHPAMPEAMLRSSPIFAQTEGEIRFYEVGRSATVIVIDKDGFFNLRTNGLPEASTSLLGAPPGRHNQQMLAVLPVLARPDVETMLIVGLGAGAALEGVPKSVRAIDVVELEPEVVAANRSISAERAYDPIADPRVNLIINDARSAMALTSKRYDAIVSQPSHPWTAGASHLYTREYMQLAKSRLAESGVYLQWMNTQFVDEQLLRSLCATVLDVFEHVRVYQWNTEILFFLGSDAPLEIERGIAETGRPISDDPLVYLEKGVGSVEDIVAALTMDQAGLARFAAGSSPITDNDNAMATRSANVIGTADALRGNRLYDLFSPYDPLLDRNSSIRNDFPTNLNYSYVSRRLENIGLKKRAVDLANSLVESGDSRSLVMIGLGQLLQGDIQESDRNLQLALQANPDDQQARYALLQRWFPDILNGVEVPAIIAEEVRNLRGTAAATARAWLAASRGDLNEVVNLDAALASVLPSDLWYEVSVRLRAEWRIRLTTPEYQPRMANEAIQLIDSAIAFFPNLELHAMRLDAAVVAGNEAAAIETARRLVFLIERDVTLFDEEPPVVRAIAAESSLKYIKRVERYLENLDAGSEMPAYKRELLESSVAHARQSVMSLQAPDRL